MNMLKNSLAVTAAVWVMGLSANAFATLQYCNVYNSNGYADVLNCSTNNLTVPANESLVIKVDSNAFWGAITADFKVMGAVTGEVYWRQTITSSGYDNTYIAPVNTRVFKRWVNGTASNLRGYGAGVFSLSVRVN